MPTRRGRPHEGPALADKLDGCSEEARQRLKVIFQTLAGVFTIDEACRILGIRRSAFHKLRTRFIAQSAQLLEPKRPGRRKKLVTPEQTEIERLRRENEQLRFELRAQQVREEIGLLMPHLIKPPADRTAKKKKT